MLFLLSSLFLLCFLFDVSFAQPNGVVFVNPTTLLFETFDNTLPQADQADSNSVSTFVWLGIAGGAMVYSADPIRQRIYLMGGFTGYSPDGKFQYTNQIYTSVFPPITPGSSLDPFLYSPANLGGGNPSAASRYLGKMSFSGVLFPPFAPNAPQQPGGIEPPEYITQCSGHIGGFTVFHRKLYHGVLPNSCFYSPINDLKVWKKVQFLLPPNPLPQVDMTYLLARFDHASVVQISTDTIVLRRLSPITISGVPFLTLIGGVNGSSLVNNDVIRVIPYFGEDIGEIEVITDAAPFPKRAGHAAVVFGPKNVLIISGGFTGVPDIAPRTGIAEFRPIAMNDVWFSPDQGRTWFVSTNNAPWAPRFYHNMLATTTAIYVLNGVGTDGFSTPQGFSDLWRSIDFGATWEQVTVQRAGAGKDIINSGVYLAQACVVRNRIVTMGGISMATGQVLQYSSISSTQVDTGAVTASDPASVQFGTANRQFQPDNSLDLPGYAIALLVIGILLFILLVACISVMVFNVRQDSKKNGGKYTRWNTKVSKPVALSGSSDGNMDYNSAVNTEKPLGLGLSYAANQNQNQNNGSTNTGGGSLMNSLDVNSNNRFGNRANTVTADRGSLIELQGNPVIGSFDEKASSQFGNLHLTNNAPAQSGQYAAYGSGMGMMAGGGQMGMGMGMGTNNGFGSTGGYGSGNGMGTMASMPSQTYGSGTSSYYPSNTNSYYSGQTNGQQNYY